MARGPLIVRTMKMLDRTTGRLPRCRRDAGAGAPDHGGPACRTSRPGSPRAPPRRPRGGFDLRQSGAVRGRLRTLPAIRDRSRPNVAALRDEGVDLVWAPPREVMYPEGFATSINVKGPAIVDLEDRFRPHFFGGVATVVAKLFAQCRPDFAMFGEKDYQQLKL